MTIKDLFNFKDTDIYLPWPLRSQSSDKAFRSVRRTSIIYSTIINVDALFIEAFASITD